MKVHIQKNINKIIYIIAAFVLCMLTVFAGGVSSSPAIAFAETASYSNVLTDLKKDNTFDENNYPFVATDYSLQVIQLAESTDGELFVYVYQPSGAIKNFYASSINISTSINDGINFYNYKLIRCNYSGVFYKYLVKDFAVSTDNTRYYAITSIYRPFDETIDRQAENENIITEVNFEVGKQYCFSTINGQPYVSALDIETIVITDKFVGFCRYEDSIGYTSATDSHFVAFNTDKRMDKLLEADVYYTSQEHTYICWNGGDVNMPIEQQKERYPYMEEYYEKQDNYVYLTYTQHIVHEGKGWFAGTYEWDRIETVEQFIAENDITQNVYSGAILGVNVANKITDEGKAALSGKKWVLRFAETPVHYHLGETVGETTTLVGDVTILRLKFETDGVVYNLGAIDNKQTGSGKPINEEHIEVTLSKNFKWLLGLLFLVLLLVVLYMTGILPLIGKGIAWLVTAPFRGISALIKSSKTKKQTKTKRQVKTNGKKKK